MSGLLWPDEIHCHDNEWSQPVSWKLVPPSLHQTHLATCSYCGSMNPRDLVEWLEHKGMKLEGADYKYGWPHKFYLAGNRPDYPIKFYNDHLLDLDETTFQYVTKLIEERSRIHFEMREGKLYWRAPSPGYQHYDPADYSFTVPDVDDE